MKHDPVRIPAVVLDVRGLSAWQFGSVNINAKFKHGEIMSDTKLGHLIGPEAKRDAIHIAIAPVVAAGIIRPGEHIGFMDEGVGIGAKVLIGIADPFLKTDIKYGERFYMFLYPQTVTGMRHEWQHPAFESEQPCDSKAESEKWLKLFCIEHEGLNYCDMIGQLQIEGGYAVQHGSESARELGITEEFKHHFRIVTGSDVLGSFSCSC